MKNPSHPQSEGNPSASPHAHPNLAASDATPPGAEEQQQTSRSTALVTAPAQTFTFSEEEFMADEKGFVGSQLLFILILVFSIIAYYWASTAELDEQVRAQGTVIPPSDVQTVQSILSGIITDIDVSLGSSVQEGDVLFRMEDKQGQAEYEDNEISIRTAQAAVLRLQAEAAGDRQLNFPIEIITSAPSEVAREQLLFNQRLRTLDGELGVLRSEAESLRRNIRERQAVVRNAQNVAVSLQQEFDLIKPLVDAGHEPRIKLIDLQRRIEQAEGEAEVARLSIQTMEADLDARELRSETVFQHYSTQASGELIEQQTLLAQALARRKSLEGRIGYAEVKAPHNGTISALHLNTIGSVVREGTLLAEIVPDQTEVVVRAKLRPEDIADVSLGQDVKISLTAYDVSRYGSLTGTVTNIATNTTEESNQPAYYETLIEIPDPIFAITGQRAEIRPGMLVTADIIGGKRTVLDYILSPIKRATDAAFREK